MALNSAQLQDLGRTQAIRSTISPYLVQGI